MLLTTPNGIVNNNLVGNWNIIEFWYQEPKEIKIL